MGRIARVVVPESWHHVTQRGNHQQRVFYDDGDRKLYLDLLRSYCLRRSVRITGYCLMGNHVHLLVSPARATGLAQALGRTHNDYARWLNLRRRQSGHVWQNRFYSCPLDEDHKWAALRYVELNPVRSGLVERAEEWPWSSAPAHVTETDPAGLIDWADWRRKWCAESWGQALRHGREEAAMMERIRDATRTGRPAGGEDFVTRVESVVGRTIRVRKRGPKPKAIDVIRALEIRD